MTSFMWLTGSRRMDRPYLCTSSSASARLSRGRTTTLMCGLECANLSLPSSPATPPTTPLSATSPVMATHVSTPIPLMTRTKAHAVAKPTCTPAFHQASRQSKAFSQAILTATSFTCRPHRPSKHSTPRSLHAETTTHIRHPSGTHRAAGLFQVVLAQIHIVVKVTSAHVHQQRAVPGPVLLLLEEARYRLAVKPGPGKGTAD